MLWNVTSRAAGSNNQHDQRPPSPRLRQTTHDQTTSTTKAHDQNEDDTKDDEQDDNDTPLILSRIYLQLNLRYTKATTSHTHTFKKAATRVSRDTLILSETHLFPAQMPDHLIPSGKRCDRNTVFHYFCIQRVSFANQKVATAHALWCEGKSGLYVYRELRERVIIVIDR